MTTIAWDGKTLAADKQATNGTKYTVTKIRRLGDQLLFSSGSFDMCLAMFDWYEGGANKEDFPKYQDDKDDWVSLMIVNPKGELWRYERTPYPFLVEERFFSVGSGRDFALGAMAMGATAAEAVEIASRFDPNTGMGIDTLTIGTEE